MRLSRISLIAVVGVGLVGSAPALAASGPKTGYYVDKTNGVSLKLGTSISGFTAQCVEADGTKDPIVVKPHIAVKGRSFSWKGAIKPKGDDAPQKVTFSIKGTFALNGKAKGTIEQTAGLEQCDTLKFSAKYAGTKAPKTRH